MKKKHLFSFLCKHKEREDNSLIKFFNYDEKIFITYKELFLGVFEKGILRLPYRDFILNKPELFIAIDIYNRNCKNNKINKLKLNVKEVIF